MGANDTSAAVAFTREYTSCEVFNGQIPLKPRYHTLIAIPVAITRTGGIPRKAEEASIDGAKVAREAREALGEQLHRREVSEQRFLPNNGAPTAP